MDRMSRDQMLMEIAEVVSNRGTCSRLQVGAVISRDGRPIVTGYNGAPAGLPHCTHTPFDEGGCTHAEHAERNAVAFAARYGLALEGSELHCTHMPCLNCARMIINAGIVRVVYDERYRRTEGVELLREVGIEVVDMQNYLMVK